MNFVSKFDGSIALSGHHPKAQAHVDTVSTKAPADAIIVKDAQLLFGGDFKRSGSDLVISKGDHELRLEDYFRGDKHAPLASPDGAYLTGKLVDALTGHVEIAQADGSASAAKIIGHVTKLTGTATVVRNGVSIILNNGDNVHQGDVVQSGSNSSLGITFIDGSVFGLASNAKMVLNEMIYDPNGSSNSSLLSLVSGTISFVAGATAKHGDMKVDTPVATMGIRGTAVLVEIEFDVLQQNLPLPPQSPPLPPPDPLGVQLAPPVRFQVLIEPDGTSGSYVLLERTTLAPMATVSQPGTVTTVSGNGAVSFLASAQLSPEAMRLINEVFSQRYTDNSNPRSDTHFTDSIVPDNTFAFRLASGDPGLGLIHLVVVPDNTTSSSPPPPGTNGHVPGPPGVAAFRGALAERLHLTGSSLIDTTSNGISYSDVNVGDTPSASATFAHFTYNNRQGSDVTGALTPEQLAAISAVAVPLVITQDPAGRNTGVATWTYNIADHALDFLADGETLTLTYIARVDNNFAPNNEAGFASFTITITGTNDVPTVSTTSNFFTERENASQPNPTGSTAPDTVTGTVTFADVDLTDTHAVTIQSVVASGVTTGVPDNATMLHWLSLGALTDSTNGVTGSTGWTFTAQDQNFDYLAVGEQLVLTYTIRVDDHHGGVVDVPVTVTVTGTNDTPTIATAGSNVTELVGTNNAVTDTASGTVTFTDVDLSDRPVVSTQFSDFRYLDGQGNEIPAASLTPEQLAAIAAVHGALTVVQAAGNTNNGSATWTYNVTDSALDFIADDETLILNYVATVDDGHGGVISTPVTVSIHGADVSIHGTNDVPVVTTTNNAFFEAYNAQQPNPTGSTANDSVTGTISFTDVDLTDTHAVTIRSVAATGVTTGVPDNDTMLHWLSLGALTDSTNGHTGSTAWTFSARDQYFDYLTTGEQLVLTYTIRVDDHHGGVVDRTVTVTATGTNDTPVITSGSQAPLVDELPGVNTHDSHTPDTAHGTITFADVDLSDTHSVTILPGVTTGGTTTGLDAAAAAHWLSLTSGTFHDTSGGVGGSQAWTFSAEDHYFDYLADGEHLTLTYAVQIDDHHGGVVTQDVVVTVNGHNDAPELAADVSGTSGTGLHTVPELTDRTNDTTDNDGATGSLAFRDLDLSDHHTYTYSAPAFAWLNSSSRSLTTTQQSALAAASTFTLTPVDSTGTGHGTIGFAYGAADNNFDFLAVGESLTITYNVTVFDQHLVSSTQAVIITVTGANDAPVAVADTGTGIIEAGVDANNQPIVDVPSIQGNVLDNDTDVDLTDTHNVTGVVAGTVTSELTSGVDGTITGTYGSLVLHADGTWTYTLDNNNPLTNALAQDAPAYDIFSYTESDHNGGWSTTTLTINIRGTNDAPVTNSKPVAVTDENPGAPVVEQGVGPGNTPVAGNDAANGNVLLNDHDVDTGDTMTVQGVAAGAASGPLTGHVGDPVYGTYGHVTIGDDGIWTYTLDNTSAATQGLTQGQHVSDVFTYTMHDALGSTSSATLTIAITGTNDAPTLSDAPAGTLTDTDINDSFGNLTGTLVGNDVDSGETTTLSYGTLVAGVAVHTAVAGHYGSLTVSDDGSYTYVPDAAAINALNAGDYTDTFTVQTADVHGATGTATLTVNVTGANDTPTLTNVTTDTLTDTSIDDSFSNLTGTLTGADRDSGDTLTYDALDTTTNSFTNAGVAGQYGTLTVDSSGNYTYVADAAAINALVAGDYTDTFTIQTTDSHGAATTATLTVPITGANDTPEASDVALTSMPSGIGWALDPDNGHYYRYVSTSVNFATATANAASDHAYLATITSAAENGFVAGLIPAGYTAWTSGFTTDATGSGQPNDTSTWHWGDGPEAGSLFTYTNWDPGGFEPNGGFDATNAAMQIYSVGTWNDVPTTPFPNNNYFQAGYVEEWGGRATDPVNEDATRDFSAATLLAQATDRDQGDTLTVSSVDATSADGATVTLSLSGTTITYDPTHAAALQALAAGETATDTFSYTVSDGHGGTSTATATVNVVGANDAPTFVAPPQSLVDHLIGISVPVGSQDGQSHPYDDDVWSVSGTAGHLNDAIGIGYLVNPSLGDDFTAPHYSLHGHAYVAPYEPDPSRYVVTFQFDTPEVVTELDVIEHVNGVTILHGYAGNSLGSLTDIGSVVGSLGDLQGASQMYNGELNVFQFNNTIAGTYFQVVVEGTSFDSGFALFRMIPEGPVATNSGAITEASGVTGWSTADTASGLLQFTDVDLSDTHTFTITGVSASGVTSNLPDDATMQGWLSLGAMTDATNGVTGSQAWAFSAADSNFDYLGDGEQVTLTYVVQVADGHGGTATQNVTITVTGTNDAPEFTANALAPTYSPNGSPVAIVDNVVASDVDSVNYNGGSLTATVTAGGQQGDTLSIQSQWISLDGATVNYDADGIGPGGSVAIGTLTNYDTNSLTVTLNAAADDAAVERLTQAVSFSNSMHPPGIGERTVTFTLHDGGGTANGGHDSATFDATVAITNTPPTASNVTASGNEDAASIEVDFAGTDAEGVLTTIQISTLPSHGQLYADAGLTHILHAGDQIPVAVSGPTSAYFVPDHDWSGTTEFSYFTIDDGGLQSLSAGTATINVAPVADSPTLSSDPTPVANAGEFRVNTTTANAQTYSAVGALTDGGFVIAWVSAGQDGSGTGVYAQRYDSSGAPVGGEFQVNTATADDQASPFVEGLTGGGYVISWTTGNNNGATIHAQRYDSAGTAVGGEFNVGSYGENASIGALVNGGFVITYTTSDSDLSGTYAVIYDANGNAAGAPFLVNTTTTSQQQPAAVVGTPDGNFIVSWHSYGQDAANSWGVYFQRFDAEGHRIGGEVRANDTVAGAQYGGRLAVLTDGSFVVTWQDESVGTVVARHFDANGQPLSGEVVIGNGTDDTVQALPDGGYLVTYMASDAAGSLGLFGQRVSASDTLSGVAFHINETIAGDQSFISDRSNPTAVLSSGTIVSTWYGPPNTDGTEIHGRVFTVPGVGEQGTEIRLPAITAAAADTDGSESLVLELSGYPAGSTFSMGAPGTGSHVGHWIISGADVALLATTALTITPPASFHGDFTLHVDAVVSDTATLSAGSVTDTTTTAFDLPVTVVPDGSAGDIAPSATGDLAVVVVRNGGVQLTGLPTAVTTADLQAVDPDTAPDQLTFTVIDTSHGHLAHSANGPAITSFTQAELNGGQVFFVADTTNADGSAYVGAGSFTVALSDGVAGTPVATTTVGVTIVDAQFTVLAASGYNFDADDPIDAMGSGTIVPDVPSPGTSFAVVNAAANRDFIFTGHGFTYDPVTGALTAGTIVSILETTDDASHTPLASFALDVAATDWMNAVTARASGDNSLIEALTRGWTFNFIGNAGPDAFGASDLNDIFTGRAGDDTFDGQFGYDRANYGAATGPIDVQLANGVVTGDASVGTDTLRSIELVTGSNYADTFDATGFSAFSQNAGSRVTANTAGLFNEFEGRGGDDIITGNGTTRISYFHATSGVTVTFDSHSWNPAFNPNGAASGTATGDLSTGTDHFTGVYSVRGSNFNDVFHGSNNPSGTSEVFEGLGGDDLIDGGGGFDRAVYNLTHDGIGIDVELAAGTVTDLAGGNEVGHDTLLSVEAIWGTEFADYYNAAGFSGTSANAGSFNTFNEFEGGAGDDTVIGNGNTRVYYGHATGGVVVTLGSSGSGDSFGNASVGHDHFNSGVNAVRGSEFNDIITGNGGNNTLEGQGGNDVLNGRGGADVLTGGTGADIFVYGPSYGNDVVSDFNRSQGDRIDLRAFANIHSVADVQALAADPGSNVFTFSAGNTLTLNGVTSATLLASDFIFAGQVAVTVQTLDGYDFSTLYDDMAASNPLQSTNNATHIFAVDAARGITFELIGTGFTYDATGHVTGGTITEIDILDTTDPTQTTQDHVLVNSNGWNIGATSLFSAIGAYQADHTQTTGLDTIFNAATYSVVGSAGFADNNGRPHNGADVLIGGNHADVFNGLPGPFGPFDPGSDTVDYSHATSGVSVNLLTGATSGAAAAGDTFISIENLRGTAFDDVLIGDGNNNVIEGGLGHNVLDGGGNGVGLDFVSYQHAVAGVTVNLNIQDGSTSQDTIGAGIDTLSNFEGVIGSAYNDTLTGSGNSVLEGGLGDDILTGQSGGNDTASYLHATSGVIVDLALSGSQDTFGAGHDTLVNIQNLWGSQHNDILTGNSGDNILFGNGGNDTFVFNTELGGIGHDTIGDFRPGEAHISLDYAAFDAGSPTGFSDWLASHATAVNGGQDVQIDLNPDGSHPGAQTILLQGVALAQLRANDFLLPGGNTA